MMSDVIVVRWNQLLDVLAPYLDGGSNPPLTNAVLAVVASMVVWGVLGQTKAWRARVKNKEIRQRKRQVREQEVENLRKRVAADTAPTEEYEKIVVLSFSELQQKLQNKELKAMQVLRAYQYKALQSHDITNALVGVIKEAETWAKEVDEGKRGGLLAGIPISIKHDVAMKGYDHDAGCAVKCFKPQTEDCVIVKALLKQGAIPFVRTNFPQLFLSIEGDNPIYGPTLNVYDTTRHTGGSSSGEGALISAGGSILGIGSDIGGSIRIPAAFCGIQSFKPSAARVSHRSLPFFSVAECAVPISRGPLSRDVDGLVMMMKAFWCGQMFEIDHMVPKMPFNSQVYEDKRRLRIGYYTNNGDLECTPASRRAVMMAKKYLEEQGHEVIPWQPKNVKELVVSAYKNIVADTSVCEDLKNDEVDHTLRSSYDGMTSPNWLLRIISFFTSFTDPQKARSVKCFMGCSSIKEYHEARYEAEVLGCAFDDGWRRDKLDALISPSFPFPALPCGSDDLNMTGISYTIPYNVIDYPAGIVRMTKVTASDLEEMKNSYPRDTQEQKDLHKALEGSEGMPCGVQVAARTYNDELVLRVMKELEEAADFPTHKH